MEKNKAAKKLLDKIPALRSAPFNQSFFSIFIWVPLSYFHILQSPALCCCWALAWIPQSLLAYVIGVLWVLVLLPSEIYNERTYFSENALLPDHVCCQWPRRGECVWIRMRLILSSFLFQATSGITAESMKGWEQLGSKLQGMVSVEQRFAVSFLSRMVLFWRHLKIFPSRQFILDSLRGFGLETGAQRFSHLALDITEGVGVQGLHVSHLLRVFLVWPLILSLSCLRTDPEWDQRVWSPEGHERRPYRVNSALYPPDYPRRKRFGVCWFTFVSASLTPKSQTDNVDGITMTLMLVDKFRSTHHLLCSNLTCPLHCHHSIVIQPTNTGPKTWLLSSQIKDSPECLHGLRHTTTSKRQVWDLFCDFSVLHLTPFLPILSASNYNGAAEYQRGSDSIGFEYWTLRNSRAISQDGNKIWYPPFSFFTLEQKKQTKLKN